MSNFSLIGNNTGSFFTALSGAKQGVIANNVANKAAILSLLQQNYQQAPDGSSFVLNCYINLGIPFVPGTTEDTDIATLLSGATEITDVLQPGTWTQTLMVSGNTLTWTRQNSINVIQVNPNGAAKTLSTVTNSGVQNGDIVILTTTDPTNAITVQGGGNLDLNTSFVLNSFASSITLIYNTAQSMWCESTRTNPIASTHQTGLIVGGDTIALNSATDSPVQIYTGTGTLVGNTSITGNTTSPVPPDGFTWTIQYNATFSGSSTVTIFGVTLTANQKLVGGIRVWATWDLANTVYRVFIGVPGIANSIDATMVQSVNASAIVGDLPVGQIPLTSGAILVGNGSNIATAVTPSGDVAISNSGVNTIQANAVTTTKIINNAVTTAKIADGAITAAKLDPTSNVNQEVICINCSFASTSQGTIVFPVPYACTVTFAQSNVTTTIAGTDAGTVTVQNAASATMVILSLAASSGVGGGTSGAVSVNNTVTAGSFIQFVIAKTTAGGAANVFLYLTRT